MSTTRHAGHFLPLVPFAHAALRAGHEVRVAAPRSYRRTVERAELRCLPVDDPPDEPMPDLTEFAAHSNDDADYRAIADMFVRRYARAALPVLLDIIAGWRPDAIVRESLDFAAEVAAERCGVPLVRVSLGLAAAEESLVSAAAADAVDELRGQLGLTGPRAAQRLRASPYFTLSPALMDDPVDQPAAAPPGQLWRFRDIATHPAPLPAWWTPNTDPLIYLTFGTVAGPFGFFPDLHRAAVAALARLPVRVLLTLGGAGNPLELGPLPAQVHVERWIEEPDVVPHAGAVVCHGGAGSTLRALASGVPLVMVPLFADQARNARRVADLGAGISLPELPNLAAAVADGPATVAPWLGPAVRALLDDPSYRRRAQRVADAIHALPPVDAAVDVLRDCVIGNVASSTGPI